MKIKLSKKMLIISFLTIITLNIVTVFLWQFAKSEDDGIIAVGGTITSATPIEDVINVFGGPDAVSVIKSDDKTKIIIKNNITLTNSIIITSGNYIVVSDDNNHIIKRSNIDLDNDSLFDFSADLFIVNGATLSLGDGTSDIGISNLSYDDLITNNMKGTLTISGNAKTLDGYISGGSGNATKPSLTSESVLIGVNAGTLNVYANVIIADNYSEKSCLEISNRATFNMHGGIITKCVSTNDSSAIKVDNATFNLYAGTIESNETTASNKGTIYNSNNSITNIYGGLLTHNIDNNNYGAITGINFTLNINGGSIYNNYGTDITLNESVTFTMNNGYIDNFKSLNSNNIININNGVINNPNNLLGTIAYNGSSTTHYKVTIPGGSSSTTSDYIRIYNTNDSLITFYENKLLGDVTSLNFYLAPGEYYAVIDQSKTYYFTVLNSDLVISPSGITVTDETFGFNSDGMINGLISTMLLSSDNIDYMELPSYPVIENVPAGVYYVKDGDNSNYVKLTIKGTLEASGGTLTNTTSVDDVTNIFGGSDNVIVNKINNEYEIMLQNNILLQGTITINSGNFTIISDGGNYTIKRDINTLIGDMFKINGGTLSFGKSTIINNTEKQIKYSFIDEEIIKNIGDEIPKRANFYITDTDSLIGITNINKGTINIDGGSDITSGYINNIGNTPSSCANPSSGVIINNNGIININANITLTNNYNSGTRINGSAIYNNGTFNMYGGKILKCVRNSSASTYGSAIYNLGTTNIYSGEIAYNETNSNASGIGTIYTTGTLMITDIYLHHNFAKTIGSGIYLSNIGNIYNGVIKNNISFNYKTTTNNTYAKAINDDIYVNSGNSELNILKGTMGYITINGSNTLNILKGTIDNVTVNGENNEVDLYPLVNLTNDLNDLNNSFNDITNSVSTNLNFINVTKKSIKTFNSASTLNISFYQEYQNDSYERYLTFSNTLPANTGIILRRTKGNVITNYYYKNLNAIPNNTNIYLSEFKTLGATTSFIEASESTVLETLDFIIDFAYSGKINSGVITYHTGNSYAKTNYEIDDSDVFSLSDVLISDKGLITSGTATFNPSIYSNYYFNKSNVLILTLSDNTKNIPFILTNNSNIYKPINNMVILTNNDLTNYQIKNIDGKNLPTGNYTLTVKMGMTYDNRVDKYSVLDGIVLTKNYAFEITNEPLYALTINNDNRVLTINDINNGTFNFNITKTNLNNGSFAINAYKKNGNLTFSDVKEPNWTISESNNVLTITIPKETLKGTYKMVISYVVNDTEVIKKELIVIIN